jgi:hypothetical protein
MVIMNHYTTREECIGKTAKKLGYLTVFVEVVGGTPTTAKNSFIINYLAIVGVPPTIILLHKNCQTTKN